MSHCCLLELPVLPCSTVEVLKLEGLPWLECCEVISGYIRMLSGEANVP